MTAFVEDYEQEKITVFEGFEGNLLCSSTSTRLHHRNKQSSESRRTRCFKGPKPLWNRKPLAQMLSPVFEGAQVKYSNQNPTSQSSSSAFHRFSSTFSAEASLNKEHDPPPASWAPAGDQSTASMCLYVCTCEVQREKQQHSGSSCCCCSLTQTSPH